MSIETRSWSDEKSTPVQKTKDMLSYETRIKKAEKNLEKRMKKR